MRDGNTDAFIQNMNWGPVLRMSKIPKNIVKRIGSIYFENCRKLFLLPKSKDDLDNLSKILDPAKNALGFVHFPAPGNSFKCFIIVNCGKESPVKFLGLIPDQDELFIQVLKVILKEAKKQLENRVEKCSFSEPRVPVSKKQRQEACCTNNATASQSNDNAINDRESDKANKYIDMSKFLEVEINEGKPNR